MAPPAFSPSKKHEFKVDWPFLSRQAPPKIPKATLEVVIPRSNPAILIKDAEITFSRFQRMDIPRVPSLADDSSDAMKDFLIAVAPCRAGMAGRDDRTKHSPATSASAASNSTSTIPSTSPPTASSTSKSHKSYSCKLCKQRKVKCNRKQPCSSCIKHNVECVPAVTLPPRRGKRKHGQEEPVVASSPPPTEPQPPTSSTSSTPGAKIDGICVGPVRPSDSSNEDTGTTTAIKPSVTAADDIPPSARKLGRFVTRNNNARYFESNLWTSLTDEFQDKSDILRVSDEVSSADDGSSVLFGFALSPTSIVDLSTRHPEGAHVFILWQKFLDNVNPLSKIVHAPTVQAKLLDPEERKSNKPLQALLFCMYFVAAMGMDPDEVITLLGEEKKTVLGRYRANAEAALAQAGFLRSLDLTVLQAYILFLLAIRPTQDSGSFWVLSGVAVRIAMRMGLHKDTETSRNLPPFDREMRRRIALQIRLLDGRASGADASGGPGFSVINWDSKPPLNINDADIYPEMTNQPPEHTGLTEMSFVNLRACFGEFLIKKFGGEWTSMWGDPSVSYEEKKTAIDELESQLEDKYVKMCNPAVPLHQFITALARAVVSRMRIAALHPRHYKAMPQADRDAVVNACIRMLYLDNSVYRNKDAQRYLWHIRVHFQSDALIIVLSEVSRMISGNEDEKKRAEGAWEEVEGVYENHAELMNGSPLHVAIGNLAVKAWEHREAFMEGNGGIGRVPEFIKELKRRMRKAEVELVDGDEDDEGSSGKEKEKDSILEGGGEPIFEEGALPEAPPIDWSPLEWEYWDELMRNYGVVDRES